MTATTGRQRRQVAGRRTAVQVFVIGVHVLMMATCGTDVVVRNQIRPSFAFRSARMTSHLSRKSPLSTRPEHPNRAQVANSAQRRHTCPVVEPATGIET